METWYTNKKRGDNRKKKRGGGVIVKNKGGNIGIVVVQLYLCMKTYIKPSWCSPCYTPYTIENTPYF